MGVLLSEVLRLIAPRCESEDGQNRFNRATGFVMVAPTKPFHVSLLALPECAISTLTGVYDVLNAFTMLAGLDDALPTHAPFEVDIIGLTRGPQTLASGLPLEIKRTIDDISRTDIIIVPSVVLPGGIWTHGRYPEFVDWVARMHGNGAMLCSACSGIFLLAETGLFDNRVATIHWNYAESFKRTFPKVTLMPEQALMVSGDQEELVTSGASMTWHDLILYLISRHVGATAAQTVARFYALQWHHEGLSPYIVFQGRVDHGDAIIADAQTWLAKHFSVADPVEQMIKRAKIPERTFKRRFKQATGHAPLAYVQRLRVEDAKRRLERTDAPVDEIGWKAGYEDPAFFRRLFKRTTGISPGSYRRKFRIPTFAQRDRT